MNISKSLHSAIERTSISIFIFSIFISSFAAPIASAAPGDIVYKPAIGKLGQDNPFKTLSDPRNAVIDSVGRIYVSDFYNSRIVRMDADGSDPVILGMASQNPPYDSTEYSQNNSTGGYINNILIGQNDTLYVITGVGINTFNAMGEYIGFSPLAVPTSEDPILHVSAMQYNPSNSTFYRAFESCAIGQDFVCGSNSYKTHIEAFSLNGDLIDTQVYPSVNSDKPSTVLTIAFADNKITLFSYKEIVRLNQNFSLDSSYAITDEVQAIYQSGVSEYTYIYSDAGATRETETFGFDGQSIRTQTRTATDIATMPIKTIFDTLGNTYLFEGDYAVRSFTKYSSANTIVFTKDETTQLGTFYAPIALAIDSEKNTYVYDVCSVQKFSNQGEVLLRLGKVAPPLVSSLVV